VFKKFLLIAALAFSTSAFSATIDTSGLSDAQIAELKSQAAAVIAKNAKEATGVKSEDISAMTSLASTWGTQAAQAAEGFARAISIAARELGVTVNDFLKTDAGRLTAILIIWKVAGASLVKILYAMLFVIVGQVIARVIYKRLFVKEFKEVQYESFFGMFKGTKLVPVPKGFSGLREDGEWLAFVLMLVASFGSLIIGGIII
jgi:hypothetical protein